MKRVIVTGGTGFVGANLARRLLRDGHEVHLLVRPQHNPWRIETVRDDVQVHIVDFDSVESQASIAREIRPEWIFHLAAYGAYSSQSNLTEMVRTNIDGTMNLVNACLAVGFEAFVNTGSSSEYGFKDHPPSETEFLEPNSHYAVTKASATLFCRFMAQARHVHIPTLRLYSVYGPYEEPSRLIPTLIIRGLRGEFPPLVNPEVARDYVHIDDVCEAYVLAATSSTRERGPIFNVGTGVQTSLGEVVDIAQRMLAVPAEPSWGSMTNRQWDTSVWVADGAKIRRELGWQPSFGFEEGFSATIEWFRARPTLASIYSLPVDRK